MPTEANRRGFNISFFSMVGAAMAALKLKEHWDECKPLFLTMALSTDVSQIVSFQAGRAESHCIVRLKTTRPFLSLTQSCQLIERQNPNVEKPIASAAARSKNYRYLETVL